MRPTITLGLLGAVAIAAGVLLVRQQRAPERPANLDTVPAGERQPAEISLEKLRALGY